MGVRGFLGGLVGEELLFFAVDDVLAGVEIALVGSDALALRDKLVPEDESKIDGDADVPRDEGNVVRLDGEAGDEGVEILCDGHQHADEERDVRAPNSEGRRVWHHVVCEALCLSCPHKRDMRH